MVVVAHPDPLSLDERLLTATYGCIARFGLAKTTVEDVVRASGVSRATIYRQFPGGRDELIRATVGWEIGNFLTALADHVRDAPDLATMLARGLPFAHRALGEHAVLNAVLATEPERFLPLLSTESARTIPFIADFLLPYLRREEVEGRLRPGVVPEAAADYLARAVLSLIGAPGRHDLDDPEAVRSLVAVELLGGISV